LAIKKNNEELVKALFLSLISILILSSVYYLNNPQENEDEKENDYLKSEICYYALNGIVADHHYHLQLNITIDDERIEIPMNIGFERDSEGKTIFLHPIHTYDNSGRIHVETTKNATAKLGFFFDIWGKEFAENRILNYTADDEHSVEIYMNGNKIETYGETILEPYSFIEIIYKKK
jgi:hypothetical protein